MKQFKMRRRRAAKIIILGFSILLVAGTGYARQSLSVIRAGKPQVDVRDGNLFRKAHWTAVAAVKPDIYHARRSKHTRKVTFYTDLDSIAFDVAPGRHYDFIILLNGKDSCFTRISSEKLTYGKQNYTGIITTDTIPFTIGPAGSIHINGSVNQSGILDFKFDNGADNIVLFKSALAKSADLKQDGHIQTSGFGGLSTRPVSSHNKLTIGKLLWTHESIIYVDNAGDAADGLIGYNVFEDKIVEIDYEKKLMVIHDQPFRMAEGYVAFPFELPGAVAVGDTYCKGGFMPDLGLENTVYLGAGFGEANRLYGKMKKFGEANTRGTGPDTRTADLVIIPEFAIGDFRLTAVPAVLEHPSPSGGSGISVGSDILKKFNIILDYQQMKVYLKPNMFFDTPYPIARQIRRHEQIRNLAIGVLVILIFIIAGYFRRRHLKRKRVVIQATSPSK